jgi:DNA-directed RNA polymerase subunit RPC12/RpoP
MTECIACGDGADSAEALQEIIEEKKDCPECGSEEFNEGECEDCGHSDEAV